VEAWGPPPGHPRRRLSPLAASFQSIIDNGVKSFSLFSALGVLIWACSPAQTASSPAPASPETAPEPAAPVSRTGAAAPVNGSHGDAPSLKLVNYLVPEGSEGASQSPINIVTSRAVERRHQVKFHYQTSKEHVQNLGHTVKATYDAGSTLEFDGTSYDLAQFHFHTPSEHLLDGVTYPMEMHLVHTEHDHPERFLVIGVLFKEGAANPLLQTLLRDVPAHEGESVDDDDLVDARSIVKGGEGYFHYDGSLTTPPYSETVTWLVVDQVHEASVEQIETLNRIEGNNARHIQEPRARLIDHAH
jgi:carbonic anhydrase